jgi:hypothetical protein
MQTIENKEKIPLAQTPEAGRPLASILLKGSHGLIGPLFKGVGK